MACFKSFVWATVLQLLVVDVQYVRTTQPSQTDQPRVVGGVISPEDELYKKRPWITHLRKKATGGAYSHCTGAFISHNAILTAAHCISSWDKYDDERKEKGEKKSPFVEFSVMGKTKYNKTPYKLDYKKSAVIPEDIDCKGLTPPIFDLAVITLEQIGGLPKDLKGFWPIPLAGYDVHPMPGDMGTGMGFGKHDVDGELKLDSPLIAKYRTVPITLASENNQRYCTPFVFHSVKPGEDQRHGLCYGDSGGPFECSYNGEPYLCGVDMSVLNADKKKQKQCIGTETIFVNATTEKFRNFICPYVGGNSVVGKNKTFCIEYTAVNSPAVNSTAKSDTALYYSALRSAMYIAFGILTTDFM